MSSPGRSPTEILQASRHHDAFLAHTIATRDPAAARAMLAHERRYLDVLLPALRGKRMLDLACGTGVHSLVWAEQGVEVVGIDFDHDLLGLARRRFEEAGREGAHWACGDATRLPLRAQSVDVCYVNSLLEHVPDWRACLAEVARVLRTGGVTVVYTTNVNCPLQDEVRRFPLYSWLPAPVKTRVMAWIMANRRELVNYTDFPAVNWFSYPQLRRELSSRGVRAYDRLDLMARAGRGGPLRGAIRLATRFPVLKWPYRIYSRSIALYGVKDG